jgi:ABC-type multidrug transport system fused ATPase/permease subunit
MFDKEARVAKYVVCGVLIESFTSVALLLGPVALKLAVDEASRPQFNVLVAATYLVLFAILWSASGVSSLAVLAYTSRIVNQISNLLLCRALYKQLPSLAGRVSAESGYVQGVLERLPYSLQLIVEGVLWKIAPVAIQLATALVLISLLVPLQYAAVLLAVLAAYFLFSYASAEPYEKSAESINQAAGALSASLGDVLRNAPRVVYNGAIGREIDHVAGKAQSRLEVDWRRSWLLARAAVHQYGIIAAGMAVMFVMCMYDIRSARITLGDFILLQTYTLQFALPLGAYGFVLRQAGAAFANLRETLDIAPAAKESVEAVPLSPDRCAGHISVKQITFTRPDRFALGTISFDIPAGSFTVIVGHNGSGKSTLAKMIAGLLPPDDGKVELDGQDLHAIGSRQRNQHVLYVPQELSLLNRSLRENVCYFPSTLNDVDAARLLERLAFHKDGRTIDLDMEVGESGAHLSGGQVQKVELVRLMGVTIPAIILDETTSGLDPQSDARGIAMLRERLGSRSTLVMVTHRVANAMAADQVIFLSGGRLAAIGTHHQLINECSEYRSFWDSMPHDEGVPTGEEDRPTCQS